MDQGLELTFVSKEYAQRPVSSQKDAEHLQASEMEMEVTVEAMFYPGVVTISKAELDKHWRGRRGRESLTL